MAECNQLRRLPFKGLKTSIIIIHDLQERRGAIASEALADRSSQLARNRKEKTSFKSSFK